MKLKGKMPMLVAATAIAVPAILPAEAARGDYKPVIVTRDLSDPSSQVLQPSAWVTASGTWRPTTDRAPGAKTAPGGSKGIHAEVVFLDGSFSYWTLDWKDCKIPGEVKNLSYWSRTVGPDRDPDGESHAWPGEMHLFDTGVTNAPYKGGKEYKISLGAPDIKKVPQGTWVFTSNAIPQRVLSQMHMPISIGSLATWRSGGGGASRTNCYELCDLRVTTDVGMIPENERPWSLSITMPVTANVFYYQKDKPRFTVAAGSWIGVEKTIRCEAFVQKYVENTPGNEVGLGPKIPVNVPDMKVLDAASATTELPVTEPGAYVLSIIARGMPEERVEKMAFAIVREPPKLTEQQKKMSSYGINVHGGTDVGYENFARIGMCWVRDYAYNFFWMQRARGAGLYTGWPWYPKIYKAAKDNGLYTLPCLMGAMNYDDVNRDKDAPRLPDSEWRRQLAAIFVSDTFKGQCCWELDNERDGRVWPNSEEYGIWHKTFAEVLHAVDPNAWAVMQGAAGIDLEADKRHVLSGAYREIDVLNGHRYAGGQPPELARSNSNANMTKGEEPPMYQRDVWRNWDRIGRLDGKERQLWITEWGFDWLAGFVNTTWEQAAYMQREWVLALGAGIDKMFWYWYYDNAEDAAHAGAYYDGMGMFSSKREPRPVTAAFCALRAALPADMEYLGWASLSPNHMAHVLRLPGNSLVALAFKVDPKGRDLEIVDPKAKEVRDMFGATIKPGRRTLNIAPTWYIGLDPNCEWVREAPMDVLSDTYVRNVSGEALAVRVAEPSKYDYSIEFLGDAVAKGWKSVRRDWGFDVIGPAGVPRGELAFNVVGRNGDAVKTVRVDVNVIPQAYAKSNSADFDGSFKVDIVNQSCTNRSFNVVARLPKGWVVEPAEQSTGDMEPSSRKTIEFVLKNATPAVPASETEDIPKLEIRNSDGMFVDYAPVIPREWSIRKASKAVKADGRFDEWTDDYRMPSWMVGPRGDKEGSKFYAAWSEDGFYAAVDVVDSTRSPGDPNWFWRAQDELEVMISTGTPEFREGKPWELHDHQFIFMPFAKTGVAGAEVVRPWAWLWSNCQGQPHISYNVENYPGDKFNMTVVKVEPTKNGYRMELFVPKQYMHDWSPKVGGKVGFAWQMAVGGERDKRECYWPAGKGEQTMKRPWMWGRVTLTDEK